MTFTENLKTTSGLSIFMHGVISLPDAPSYDEVLCVIGLCDYSWFCDVVLSVFSSL